MMSTDFHEGFLGLELTANEWLTNHFLAKQGRRYHQIGALPIDSGDRVLDLCCGPGHYTEYFSKLVGSKGLVHGIDKDPSLIDLAESRLHHVLGADRIHYFCGDVGQCWIPEEVHATKYDVVIFFNCLSYFAEPATVIASYYNLLRPGGRLIMKDSDFGHILVEPMDRKLLCRVVQAALDSPPLSFDNFFGRNLPALAQQISKSVPQVDIWSYPMYGNLSEPEKKYVSVNLMTLLAQGKEKLDSEDIRRWTSHFSLDAGEPTICQDNFFFLMHEIVVHVLA